MVFKHMGLWDLAYNLDPTNKDECEKIDPYLSEKLKDITNLEEIYYYLCYGDIYKLLPKTNNRINEILKDELKKEKPQWYFFRNFSSWLNNDLRKEFANEWLKKDSVDVEDIWVLSNAKFDQSQELDLLEKLIGCYKKRKKSEFIRGVEHIFDGLSKNNLKSGCDLLFKATPALSATLLRRNDIEEKYTIKGLKSISKLSKQRNLNIKIDFNMLANLGPKGRLDAMKQLLGMFDAYYKFKSEKEEFFRNNPNARYYYSAWREEQLKRKSKNFGLPFTEIPKKEDVENFLFPCSIKYNDQVVAMMERFNELIEKEEEDGKCIQEE